jgi:transcriptional regulator with XRE-family HTH domain
VDLTKKEEQGARLFSLLEALNLSQTEFAERIGVSQAYVNRMIKGDKSISYKVIDGITIGFRHVNITWLLTGYGYKFLPETNDEKVAAVSEPEVIYLPKSTDPLNDLRGLLEEHERRIGELEAAVRWLRGEEDQ